MSDSVRNPAMSSWTVRRRFMFAVSAFCALAISYVLVARLDTTPADTAVTMGFFTLATIVGSYVFGAAWEDISASKSKAP